jgi:hypothetical protein
VLGEDQRLQGIPGQGNAYFIYDIMYDIMYDIIYDIIVGYSFDPI